CQQGYTNPFSF
nr:immunoglobulin light chain junction region [Macaca mulatta]